MPSAASPASSRQRLQVGLIGREEIAHQFLRVRLRLRREVFGDVDLAQSLAHEAIEQLHAARRPIQLLLATGKGRAVQLKRFIVESFRQIGAEIV